MCGDDPAVEGDTWGTGDTHYGDRVGGEGGGDCEGRRSPAQTHSIKLHRAESKGHSYMEAPNPKHQIPNKSQSPKFETKSDWSFEIGIWSLFGICDL